LVNKGFIIWLSGKFFLRDTAGSSERARWLHLARSGSQSQRAIWFILLARGASHIISISYCPGLNLFVTTNQSPNVDLCGVTSSTWILYRPMSDTLLGKKQEDKTLTVRAKKEERHYSGIVTKILVN